MSVTFALIPGAGGAAWYWHRVVPLLEQRGADVVAIDLPAADAAAGLAEYTDCAASALRDVDGRLVVVGQSMGAYTAGSLAARRPVDLVVLLNPMTPAPGESPGQWWENTGQPEAAAAYRQRIGLGRSDFDPTEDFFHDVPDDVTQAAFAQPEPDQADRPFAQPWPLTAWPDVATRVVQGADDRLFPVDFQRGVVRERLGCDVDVMPGGHLVALSRPDDVADRLDRYRIEYGLR